MSVRTWWPGGARVAVPFSVATVLAWVLMPIGSTIDWPEYWAATGLLTCSGIVMTLVRRASSRHGVVLEALVFLAAVGMMRDASGGFHSSASVLALIPVLYTALGTRSRRDLAIVIAAVLAFFIVPRLIVGGANYPASQYRSALLFVLVSGTTGVAVQSLVASVQAEAAKARSRGRMLEEVADTARTLLDSPQVRDDLCVATNRISEALATAIYEPRGGVLECTAITGLDLGGRVVAHPGSLLEEVFLTGQSRYVDADVAARVGSVELWERSGSPAAVLYEPLSHGGEVIGVLLVAWPERIHADPTRRTVATLIAGQAASVIARSDVLHNLADEAHTDALTGLPNRRAWDGALARAFASASSTITLAMLDLDNFKEFNDSFGHPAGDRLLRATAAAWRDQLRGGDLLARLGGEEFGLLICDVSPQTACDVVERLRACIPEGRTASAGVAVRAPGESADSLLVRADAALYEAKALGRDRTHVSASA